MKPIHHRSWISRDLCDTIFLPEYDGDPQEAPPSGIIYCPLDQIVDFFKLCKTTNNRYIVVSACSDFGLHLQAENPVERDMQKWLPMQDVTGLGYNPAMIPPRCNVDRCKIADTFSVKMYSFTRDTFNTIPENVVCWYSTNINVSYASIPCLFQSLPFGIGNAEVDILKYRKPLSEKQQRVYINWTNNTNERAKIKTHYKDYPYVYAPNEQREYEDFLTEMADSAFIMCPEGNGLDSYRIWESLYLGSIPIVHRDHWSAWMEDLPIMLCDHIGIPPDGELVNFKNGITDDMFNSPILDFDFWTKHIAESRKVL